MFRLPFKVYGAVITLIKLNVKKKKFQIEIIYEIHRPTLTPYKIEKDRFRPLQRIKSPLAR